jgi:hypothetical protein
MTMIGWCWRGRQRGCAKHGRRTHACGRRGGRGGVDKRERGAEGPERVRAPELAHAHADAAREERALREVLRRAPAEAREDLQVRPQLGRGQRGQRRAGCGHGGDERVGVGRRLVMGLSSGRRAVGGGGGRAGRGDVGHHRCGVVQRLHARVGRERPVRQRVVTRRLGLVRCAIGEQRARARARPARIYRRRVSRRPRPRDEARSEPARESVHDKPRRRVRHSRIRPRGRGPRLGLGCMLVAPPRTRRLDYMHECMREV